MITMKRMDYFSRFVKRGTFAFLARLRYKGNLFPFSLAKTAKTQRAQRKKKKEGKRG